MQFILQDYINNPYGKGNATVSIISNIKKMYKEKLQNIESKITYKWYNYKNKSLICVLTIPSESLEMIRYDVVFEFDIDEIQNQSSILELPTKVFSNSPSFSYTYANVFLKNDILCEWLKNKYNKNIKNKESTVRNSMHIVGIEKTIYMGSLFLESFRKYSISNLLSSAELVSSYNKISNTILHQDDVESKYRTLKKQLSEQKKKEKMQNERDLHNGSKKVETSKTIYRTEKVNKNKMYPKKAHSVKKIK